MFKCNAQTVDNFEILKEWYGRNGIKSRLIRCWYKGSWCYALDYNNCRESVDIDIRRSPLGIQINIPEIVPKLYKKEVRRLICIKEEQFA